MKRAFVLIIGALLLFAAGCSNGTTPTVTEKTTPLAVGESKFLPNGDLQEATASIYDLPAFLDGKDEMMRTIYLAAAASNELLEWIPCYCGCGESAGHQHNGHCFYNEVRADGTVVWDDHGTRCNNCLEIATYSIMMQIDGKSVLEIREWIDENYKEGYAKPTPTPMPKG